MAASDGNSAAKASEKKKRWHLRVGGYLGGVSETSGGGDSGESIGENQPAAAYHGGAAAAAKTWR